MRRRSKVAVGIAAALLVAGLGYTVYAGWEGSRQLVEAPATGDCRTPEVQYGWSYEAINYDIADDAVLAERNPDLTDCTYQGETAGDEIVTDDGERIAGWYVPAGNGAGPSAPTVVLAHGFRANKSGILQYGAGLHEDFNLVVFDMRNVGRSTGDVTTAGVLEQRDLRAVLDWLERTKHPERIGVLGNSLGAVTGLAEAIDDPRVEALALDSMHTRMRYQVEARLIQNHHPPYPGTWAIFAGTQLRTGADIGSIDAEDELSRIGKLPILLIHGTSDTQDLPSRTQSFYDEAVAAGVSAELHWCEGAGHEAKAGMPVSVCRKDFKSWTHDFFARTLR
jgi:uncharacterized protein